MRALVFSVWLLLCGHEALSSLQASEPSFDAVASGRQSLESRTDLPWYDAEEDGLHRIQVEPNEDDLKRHSQWASTNRPQTKPSRGWERFFMTVLKVLAWIGLGLLVGLIIWALVWASTRSERESDGGGEVVQDIELAANRTDDLPMPVQPQHADLLAAARAFFESGELGKAITYAFAHQLVELDKHHLIQLTRGKTNRQYLRELKAHPRFIELLTPIMLAFEDVYFGHHEISHQRFQECWQDLDRFHQQLEQVAL